MTEQPLVDVRNLCVSFKHDGHRTTVVNNVSLQIKRGETVALVGESGSGKSVTAMALLRLLPQPAAHIDSGSMCVDGQNVLDLSASELAALRGRKIAAIFQEPMTALNPVQTIGAQLAEVFAIHQPQLAKTVVHQRCVDLLEQVEIATPEARLKQYPHELSGGMRQRVMIAMAIACEPALLIADEPTTALDVTIQQGIMALLQRLQRKLNMAMLLISHDLALVRHYADTVAVMQRGCIVEQGSCEQLFRHAAHSYTQQLLASFAQLQPVASSAGGHNVVTVSGLSVTFPLKKGFFGQTQTWLQAVADISFSLQQGQTLGIVGESGSGKSTLAKALLGLVPATGTIVVNGQQLNNLSAAQMRPFRRNLQIVLQDPFGSLSPRMSIERILLEPLDIHTQLNRSEKRQAVVNVLAEVGIDVAMAQRYPHEFSGGQRQRIAIARALILEPKVLVLDEPSSALDKTVQLQIISLLQSLQQRRNLSYIFISHDLQVIRAISHHILVMKAGKVVEHGDAATVLSTPTADYTKGLLAAAFY